jgi:hypothetical protein
MGCGSSLAISPSTNNKPNSGTSNCKPGKLPLINSQKKLIKTKENREKNLEPFTLICLDEHFDENDKQLRSIIDYVYCFNNFDKCEEFLIDTNQNNLIFFIVSNEYFTNIISHIHELSHIITIYVFQDNKSNKFRKENIDKHWTKRYSKVKRNNFILLKYICPAD